jgi:tetrahydromethanopterin S-methyltransferase subunit B
MEERITTLENGFLYLRRDIDEVRVDVRDIKERVGTLEVAVGKLEQKLDGNLAALNHKLDGSLGVMSERIAALTATLSHFPTKLQLALWAGGGIAAVLSAAVSMIALLLRLNGHTVAAEAVGTVLDR